jgi:ubiquinone/menaquinone biosynthesis C-methylase UbiE
MGFYAQRVVPRILNKACGAKTLGPLRERVCAGLVGEVVELGFGSGGNVDFYPATVTRVTAVEPSDLSWKLAGPRLRASAIPIERAGLDGQSLPFSDHSFDAALSTWTMCTIADAGAALLELRRVLRPGATGWPPIPGCSAGSAASTRSNGAYSVAAPSRSRSST